MPPGQPSGSNSDDADADDASELTRELKELLRRRISGSSDDAGPQVIDSSRVNGGDSAREDLGGSGDEEVQDTLADLLQVRR
jgi:hypothetical protein